MSRAFALSQSCLPWLLVGFATASPLPAAELPNIVWITAEDMSPTLGCYGDEYATTPHLDAFAEESVRYSAAFAAAPVCSPSRSSLITGMWAPTLGTSQMRSAFPIPDRITGYPQALREAGYFTSNNVKTDYNTAAEPRLIEDSWLAQGPEAHWRDSRRKDDQPFFSIFNIMTSHQSRTMVWPYQSFLEQVQSQMVLGQIHDPDLTPVPPYYPDTPVVRRTLARYYDCVTVMDSAVGQLLAQLEEDGLAENTIVFFYSDHGSGMPRHKRLLHDSGMQVPLIIRFPEKFQHLAPAAAGETVDDLVTFVDFPPSLLALAGLEAPEHFQGQTFLGAEPAEPREFVYGFRDRIDEVFDLSRSVRTQRYLYIRNYHPHLSWMQPSVFSDLGEIRQDLARELATKGTELTAAQLGFMGPTRTIEEFYDLAADPHNVSNLLAGEMSPQETEALEELRKVFQAERLRIGDTGVLPESYVIDQIQEEEAVLLDIIDGKTNHRPDLELVWEAADRVGTATDADFLIEELIYGDVPIRYWTVVALRNGFFDDAEVHDKVVDYLEDIAPSVRIEVASWLAAASDSHRATALSVLQTDIMNPQWHTALRACRAIELLGETASSTIPAMGALYNRTRFGQGDGDLFIAFSAGAFLEAMGMPTEPWDFAP